MNHPEQLQQPKLQYQRTHNFQYLLQIKEVDGGYTMRGLSDHDGKCAMMERCVSLFGIPHTEVTPSDFREPHFVVKVFERMCTRYSGNLAQAGLSGASQDPSPS